jgi:hypothetical protein
MAYTKSRPDWKNLPSLETPVTAEHIEHWEEGIQQAHVTADGAIPMPSGGTTGQVLTKTSDGVVWTDPPASGGGGGSITVDPDDSDYLVATGGAIAPDPADPDYLTFA